MLGIKSLLITGAGGFVGQSFLDFLGTLPLESLPQNIALVTHRTRVSIPPNLASKVTIPDISADLLQPWNFEFPATHVLHLAADGSSSAYSDEAAHQFVTMTKNLGDWSAKLYAPVVFHASSGACFGHFPLDFHNPGQVHRELAKRKKRFVEGRLEAESIISGYHNRGLISLRIGRLYSFIGPHLREKPHYAVAHFVEMALRNKRIEVFGNPRTTRSYLSAQDMSRWIHRSLGAEISNEFLSIGSEMPVTMNELALYIAGQTNSEVIYRDPEGEGDYYVASNAETRLRLGVMETTAWKSSVDSYIETCRRLDADER